MDKKILMLGLVISGNVFGMDKLEILNDYRNLSEQTKTEIVSKDQINDILTKFDLYKSETGEDLFSSAEKEEYDYQIKEDISDDIYAQRRHDKFLRGIEKGRLTSSYGYYYGEDESLRAEFDDRNSKMIYDMVFKAASESAYAGYNEDNIKLLVKGIHNIERQFGKTYSENVSNALYNSFKGIRSQWMIDNISGFRNTFYKLY